jgi:hypothetical protein
MISPIQKLMANFPDHKQFLLHVGTVVLTFTGAPGLIKALTETTTIGSSAKGYGASSHNGRNDGYQ